tara:strand:- start:642 stop:1235 length:594 start_codon:yes stop_codon:yes gene_type:complete
MKYLTLILLLSVTYSQDIQRTSEFKRSTAYGQDCDDTEYRDYKGSPAWKGYGGWLSECDSILSVNLDREFAEKRKRQQREKAIQDSIDTQEALAEIDNLDLDAMWENTVWEEIQDVTTVYAEVEQITAVAGVRGAEAEDEALALLYYRKSMKGLSELDLQKALGKLIIKRDNLSDDDPQAIKIDSYIKQIKSKLEKV